MYESCSSFLSSFITFIWVSRKVNSSSIDSTLNLIFVLTDIFIHPVCNFIFEERTVKGTFSSDEFSSFREQGTKKEHFQLQVLFVSENKEQNGHF